jgi:N-methylhydantoinase A
MRVGVDTGGTFTDVVDATGALVKVLSTRTDPAEAVSAGVAQVGRAHVLAHGTTVATNTLLERSGAVVALLTNEGFEDLIEIARQDRPSLYDQCADRPEPLVPRSLRLTVPARIAADGTELVALDLARLPRIPDGVETVAVCFLHADRWPEHEEVVAAELARRGIDVVTSHEVSAEHREYERLVTTVVNAYVKPSCRTYLGRLAHLAPTVLVMTSAGGLVPLAHATERPASLLLSGPAAGVRAASAVARANGWPDAVSFDMGGTSTDVCLITGGVPAPAPSRARSSGCRCASPRSTCTRSARGEVRSRTSTPAARFESARAPRAPIPARRATGEVVTSRLSPMPTSCSATSRSTARSPASGFSTSTRREPL